MNKEDEEKKELTPAQKFVNKEISDALKLLKGATSTLKGIENKLNVLKKKASEE